MQTLAQAIGEKAKEMRVTVIPKVPLTHEEASWRRLKQKVKELTSDYKKIVSEAIVNNRATRKKCNKIWDIDVEARYDGYIVILNVCEDFMGKIVRASYYAFAKHKNVCFIRDLLAEDPLSEFTV